MARTAIQRVIQHVRLLAAVQTGRAQSDAELLGRFIEQNDEAAFTVLVERHAPMVLGVCQRALRHSQDAEDACQATFLVLTRKAGSIRKMASLGSWLHGIACRVCANLKRQRARREKRERDAPAPAASANPCDGWHEIQAVLDEELQKLPERYRAALLLCYWEGKTRDEAAQSLGLTVGKLHGLLERGRAQLRARLTLRGLTLPAALCATFLTSGVATTAAAPTLVVSCTKAALLLAAGEPLAPGIIPEQVLTLTREVVQTMFITKLKIVSAFVLCTGLLATLIGASLPTQGLAQDQPKKEKQADPAAGKTEDDEAFIRRMSKDLRGIEPSPTEVYFFAKNGDSGKRQKLIDLFIQERQAKAKKDAAKQAQPMGQPFPYSTQPNPYNPNMNLYNPYNPMMPMAQPMMQPMSQGGLMQPMMQPWSQPMMQPMPMMQPYTYANPPSTGGLSNPKADSKANPKAEPKVDPSSPGGPSPKTEPKTNPPMVEPKSTTSLMSLQGKFLNSITAAKDKKEVTAITHDYLDALTKHISDHPKASDVPDGMLQVEMVYRSLGKIVEAEAWGQRLEKEHPNSPAAQKRKGLRESGSINPVNNAFTTVNNQLHDCGWPCLNVLMRRSCNSAAWRAG
jgi:RNA polymerase sigma factor (sigma-70 family)